LGGWSGITAAALTSGDKTISGNLTVNNITLASNGKINCVDDYHYIQLDQTTDTLTLQEYGKISFNIGVTKTQKALINFTTFSIFNNTIISNNTTLLSSLNVSGITTLNNTTIVYGQLSTNGNFTNGTTSNLYAGGLRINGSDYNNTIYQDLTTLGTHSADIGFTLRDYSFFNFNSLSSGNINTNLCNMSMAGIS